MLPLLVTLSSDWIRGGKEAVHKTFLIAVSFMPIDSEKVMLYLGAQMNYYPY